MWRHAVRSKVDGRIHGMEGIPGKAMGGSRARGGADTRAMMAFAITESVSYPSTWVSPWAESRTRNKFFLFTFCSPNLIISSSARLGGIQ